MNEKKTPFFEPTLKNVAELIVATLIASFFVGLLVWGAAKGWETPAELGPSVAWVSGDVRADYRLVVGPDDEVTATVVSTQLVTARENDWQGRPGRRRIVGQKDVSYYSTVYEFRGADGKPVVGVVDVPAQSGQPRPGDQIQVLHDSSKRRGVLKSVWESEQ